MYDLLLTSGHGGTDPGAVGTKYTEHELVVEINTALAKAIMNKSTAKVKVMNEKNASGQFLSTYPSATLWHSSHLNGATDKSANGSEVIIDDTSGSKDFLAKILKVLEGYGFKNRGIKNNEQLYVLNYQELLNKDANHILEWGFVTNDADVKRLLDNLTKIANDIADLYIEQYGWTKKEATVSKPKSGEPKFKSSARITDCKYREGVKNWYYRHFKSALVTTPVYRVKDNKQSGTIKIGESQIAYYAGTRNGRKIAKFFSNSEWHYFYYEVK